MVSADPTNLVLFPLSSLSQATFIILRTVLRMSHLICSAMFLGPVTPSQEGITYMMMMVMMMMMMMMVLKMMTMKMMVILILMMMMLIRIIITMMMMVGIYQHYNEDNI